jgi:hypothetical protein
MNTRERHAWLWIAGMVGITMIIFLIGYLFILATSRNTQATSRQQRLQDRLLEEEKGAQLLEETKKAARALQLELRAKQDEIASQAFFSRSSQDIPLFLQEFQESLKARELSINKISYLPKTHEKGFVLVPIELLIESRYPAFRELLHFLETHPQGLHLDLLEILAYPIAAAPMKYRVQCSIRFTDKR